MLGQLQDLTLLEWNYIPAFDNDDNYEGPSSVDDTNGAAAQLIPAIIECCPSLDKVSFCMLEDTYQVLEFSAQEVGHGEADYKGQKVMQWHPHTSAWQRTKYTHI